MQNFLKRRSDTVALIIGVLLGALVMGAYAFGINTLATELNRAIDPNTANVPAPTYNLEAASKLDLRGLSPTR